MLQCGLEVEQGWPDSCNANLCETGEEFAGAHADDKDLFQGRHQPITIISMSLGGPRSFEIRAGGTVVWKELLFPGDLLAMEGTTQQHLKHSAPKEPGLSATACRVNFTWRWHARHQAHCPLKGHTHTAPHDLPVHTASADAVAANDAIWAHLRPPAVA